MTNSLTKHLSPFALLCVILAATATLAQSAKPAVPTIDKTAAPAGLAPLPISIGGRVLHKADEANRAFGSEVFVYQWPGTYFETSFKGTEVYFRIVQGNQILHVSVDGKAVGELVKPDAGVYRVAGLSQGAHSVRIDVVTESQSGANVFGGFAGRRPRQIEFIGDSHTVGYANTSATRNCTSDEVWAKTDNSQAFAALTARQYNAEYQVNAISGRGIVRNYNGGKGDTLPQAYPYVLFDKANAYEDKSWQPQIVVIALGTNDFSTPLNAGEPWKTRDELHADYEATYVKFVQQLRAKYSDAFFVLWIADAPTGEMASEVAKVAQKLKAAGEKDVVFIPVSGLEMTGCHWHPSLVDDKLVSEKLVEVIDSKAGIWREK